MADNGGVDSGGQQCGTRQQWLDGNGNNGNGNAILRGEASQIANYFEEERMAEMHNLRKGSELPYVLMVSLTCLKNNGTNRGQNCFVPWDKIVLSFNLHCPHVGVGLHTTVLMS